MFRKGIHPAEWETLFQTITAEPLCPNSHGWLSYGYDLTGMIGLGSRRIGIFPTI